jgi:HK97 family phage major capsid protein
MNIHARDRRKWFAVNFGRSYFKSEPLISPLMIVGFAIPCLILLLLPLLLADGHSGGNFALALSPAIIVAREKAARCLNAANDIRKRYKPEDTWSAEDQINFDKAMADFATANNEVTTAQAREEQFALIDRENERYFEPQGHVINPGAAGSGVNISESFGRYLKFARFNPKNERVQARGLPDAVVDQCMEIHHEAFMAYCANGVPGVMDYAARQNRVPPREIHALLSSDQTLGGFLVPEDVRNEIIMADAGAAVLANLCRTEATSRDTMTWPKVKPHSSDSRRTSGFSGDWKKQGYVTGGTAPDTQDEPTFQRERIPVHDWVPDAVEVSSNLLEDADANVESIIAQAIGECLAFDKDDVILDGTGVNQPEGVLNAGITQIASQDADGIAYGGIIGLYTELPSQYRRNGTWVMASRTMGSILQLNTGTGGVYLFPPNNWNNTILNRPVVFLDYGMDTATAAGGTTFTANDQPIIFGDWKRYIIAQRRALRIQRLVERFAPNIGLLPSARLGGQLVLTDAFRIMKIAA